MTRSASPVAPTRDDVLPRPTVFRADLLRGQTALVSGGGTGIGQGIALLLGELGARVAVCGRRPEPLQETCALLESAGAECSAIPANIRQPEQVDALFERLDEDFGGIDLLVNNAGGQFPQHALDFSDKGWRAVVDTNLNGAWTMMQRAARRWRDRDRPGSIVNIVAPFVRGMYGVAHTVAARAGVAYLSRNLAVEWAPLRIRVNCVLPGGIDTRGLEAYAPEVRRQMADAHPLGRLGRVQEIAEAVVYLAAASGEFVTGEVLAVDGGQRIQGELWLAGRPPGWEEGG
ncbi:MAG: SDR family oxidoreductase [Proteobacteria bacterium]|nr:SDR family oxidoreductase [Pseudomonadota bacterium]